MPADGPAPSTPEPASDSAAALRDLLEALPAERARTVFTHASWTPRRADSYERLAFLGDSVLALAITSHMFSQLDPDRYGAGDLTKIRSQTVSGRSCREVAERLSLPERLAQAAPADAATTVPALLSTERVPASVIEAVIGACYLEFGYEPVAAAVVQAFAPELETALESPVDFKSALQERLARRGAVVDYEVVAEEGRPHDRTFTIVAALAGQEIGRGEGRSKKDAEQAAAQAALAEMAEMDGGR